jgi:hypothetical protein
MRKRYLLLALLFVVYLLGCSLDPQSDDAPFSLSWNGAWENEDHFFGTYSLTIEIAGANQDDSWSQGTIAGSVVWTKFDGTIIVDSPVTGTWENESYPSNVDVDIATSSNTLTMGFRTGGTVHDLANAIDTIGSFHLNGTDGQCYNIGDYYVGPNVQAAISLSTSYGFDDMAYVAGSLYAIIWDGSNYGIAHVNILDGTITDVVTVCEEPRSLAFDGTYLWLTGNAVAGATEISLYKFAPPDLTTPLPGYPVTATGYGGFGVEVLLISHNGTDLYYHNDTFFTPEVGTVDTSTGVCSVVIPSDNGNLSRTTSMAAASSGIYTSYFGLGGVWCEVNKLSLLGDFLNRICPPMNESATLALDGSTLYVIQAQRLYTLQL